MENRRRDDQEPLAEGLGDLPEHSFRLPRPPDDLRCTVLDRTVRIVRARSRRRRFLTVAAVAAAYLGGLTTAFLVTETAVRSNGGRGAVMDSPSGEAGTRRGTGGFMADPGELERRSEAAPPEERVRLLTRAGDLYLSAQYDVEKALSCYRRALNTMPASRQTMMEPDDSWLLAALKDARR